MEKNDDGGYTGSKRQLLSQVQGSNRKHSTDLQSLIPNNTIPAKRRRKRSTVLSIILFVLLSSLIVVYTSTIVTSYFDPSHIGSAQSNHLYNKQEKETKELTVVTASTQNHFTILQSSLLDTLYTSTFDFNIKVIFYDLDYNTMLQKQHQHTLSKNFPNVAVEYRKFDYESYPSHYDIHANNTVGEYAWKAAIIKEVTLELRTNATLNNSTNSSSSLFLYWLDAGTKIKTRGIPFPPSWKCPRQNHIFCKKPTCTNLNKDFEYAKKNGIFTPKSSGSLSRWTHKGTADYLHLNDTLYHNGKICSANTILIDVNNDTIYNKVIVPWAECSKVKDCIAPPGSSRENHRQDQSALSVLLNKVGIEIPPTTMCVVRAD